MSRSLRSIIVPVYRNEENITDLLRVVDALASEIAGLEAVFVVDGSPDRSMSLLREALPDQKYASKLVAHSRNFGSFSAIRTGMAAAKGDYIGVMAADLQEPPGLISEFFAILDRGEADIAFGVRTDRSDPGLSAFLSNLFWGVYRRFVIPDLPRGGVDVFACTRQVSETVLALQETNTSLVAQLFWVGFRRVFVPYERREREKGSSAWSLKRRFRYMADSVFAFSDLPILILLWSGILGLLFSGLLGTVTLVARLAGIIDQPGFATLVIATLGLFSVVITSQGIIGMYLWRAFENSKGKPTGIVMAQFEWPPGHASENPGSGVDDSRRS